MAWTIKSLNFEKRWINEFKSNPNFRSIICSMLGSNFNQVIKSPNTHVTPEWSHLANKTKKDPSKSDIILDNSNGVSIKNGSGRATSSNLNETKAIFYSVIKNNKKYFENKSLVQEIDRLFFIWEHAMGGETYLLTEKHITTTNLRKGVVSSPSLQVLVDACDQQLDPMIKSIRDNYPDFMRDVIYECLTGNYKFGDSAARARYYIRHKKDCLNTVEFAAETSSPEFMQECEKYFKKVGIAMKAGGRGKRGRAHWIRFM